VTLWIAGLLSKERALRMAWEVERRGRRSILVGSAHFFPYHFRGWLRRHIGGARTIVLEGPLDADSMRAVRESGSGATRASLYDALDSPTRDRIHHLLGIAAAPVGVNQMVRDLLFGRAEEWFANELRGLEPWMAFLAIWTRYRSSSGWTYTLDVDAEQIARGLGKDVRHFETIAEQIEALSGIPLERIVSFLARGDWAGYCRQYVRRYLDGDLDGLVLAARAFPTFCESIVERRDPILAARMVPYLDAGAAVAFVGVIHCHGVIALLRDEGFTITHLDGR
jgi:uncharacterized protein YbaP (TraB family)